MRIDENGVQHPQAIDEVTSTTLAHIAECVECSRQFPKVLAKAVQLGYNMSDEFVKSTKFIPNEERRFVEDDLTALHDLDKQIKELLMLRNERIAMIHKQNRKNHEAVQASEDWFEGNVRGNPVEDRCVEAPAETRSDYNQRRF